MRQFGILLMLALGLAGCAAGRFQAAQENANLVTNGMTVAEASTILGMGPTQSSKEVVFWRRGRALMYTGKASDAIRFQLREGRITGVPFGGVFSPAAERQVLAERQSEAAEAAQHAEAKLRRQREDLEADAATIANSIIVCPDKPTCAKVFALAQIFVTEFSDQKIQIATDTIIETYNPTDEGRIGIKVVKKPRSGSIEVVSMIPSCKAAHSGSKGMCEERRMEIYRSFRPFIEANLVK